MPRRLILRRRARSKRLRTAKRYHKPIILESEGILGSGASSITGTTTTVEYLKLVKSIFLYEPTTYRKFIVTMTKYQKGELDIVEALTTVVVLFDGYPNLIRDFNVFLPEEYALEIQEDAVVVKVYEPVNEENQQLIKSESEDMQGSLDYISKVKEAFRDDPERFGKFGRILSDYHRQKVTEVNTVQRVVALLRHHPYLVLHFNQFLPDGHEIHMFDNSSYTIEFPVTDGKKTISIKA